MVGMSIEDYQRLQAWAENPSRKPAVLSFTDGDLRQAAYAVERILKQLWEAVDAGKQYASAQTAENHAEMLEALAKVQA